MEAGIPKDLTVELAAKLVTIKEIVVRVSSEPVLSNDGQKMEAKVKVATIAKERDLTPEMIVGGPKLRGEVNSYTLCDGFRAYFNAKTGEAIGRELRLNSKAGANGSKSTVLIPLRTSPGVDRRYMAK